MTADCVYLSPSVFACPPPSSAASYCGTLERYINQLINLREHLASELIRLLVSKDVADVLFAADCYPMFEALKNGLVRANLDENYQIGDITRIVGQLLREVVVVENTMGVQVILANQINVLTPMQYLEGDGNRERQDGQLVTLALGQCLNFFPSARTWVIGQSKDADDTTDLLGSTRVSAVLHDVESINPLANIEFPLTINEGFHFRNEFDQVLRNLDLASLNVELTPQCMKELISLAVMQSGQAGSQLDWSIGSQFSESVSKLHIDRNPLVLKSLLRACVCVIYGTALEKTHALREGGGGNCSQIQKNGVSAWRRDIDHEFHLHYWSVGNRCIFASCGPHNCFSIPDPD